MNPFVSRINNSSPVVPLSIMALILGAMMSTAYVSKTHRTGFDARDISQRQSVLSGSADEQLTIRKQQDEITKLREDKTRLENALADGTKQARVINDSLQELKNFAGLTEVTGPGVLVRLNDASSNVQNQYEDAEAAIIHDRDVLKVVNELWNAGAEAISVNGLRVSVGTSFRCVGTTILVDTTKIASPVMIQAIGDSATLDGALKMPGGIVSELTSVSPTMISIEQVQKMMLPAFSGATNRKFARPVEAKPKRDPGDRR
ncbi:MAG: DUF881 domain-containing protein [Chthonomonas sp.]|nr:DUF881 domain-containing protein [Chthonomonas sp.]